MGLIIGMGGTRPQFAYDYYYGIEWDTSVSNPVPTRIGKAELHASLPVQSLIRRCVLKDNGEVNYYLHANIQPSVTTARLQTLRARTVKSWLSCPIATIVLKWMV